MIFEHGINPNCSELIIRVGLENRSSIIEMLNEIGVSEYILNNRWSEYEENDRLWDSDKNFPDIMEFNKLPWDIQDHWNIFDDYTKTNDQRDKSIEKLKEYGINIGSASRELLEMDKDKSKFSGASLFISKYPDGDEELSIWYHQHCQSQGFPMIKKIADHFNATVEPYDGGSIEPYESFLEGNLDETS
jgi:hypothetical protein